MSDVVSAEPAVRLPQRQMLFTISADNGWTQRFQLAIDDLFEGFGLWRLAWALGLSDIQLRYRGSVLGPFWLTMSTAIMIGAMGFLYAELFHVDINSYLPFLATSIILWNYLNTMVTDGCLCFTQSDMLIRGTRMPFTVHVLRHVIRTTIVLAHNVVVIAGVFVIMGVRPTLEMLLVIPGLLIWLVDGIAISFLLGAICARYRDVPQIVGSVIQIAFFITPVMWNTEVLLNSPRAGYVIGLNPFYWLLEIVRGPLLGIPLTFHLIAKALMLSVLIVGISAVGFARVRGRLSYWM